VAPAVARPAAASALPAIDWIGGSALFSGLGSVGARLWIATFRWEHAWLTAVQGGFLWPTRDLAGSTRPWLPLSLFVGTEGGALWTVGRGQILVGALAQFDFVARDVRATSPVDLFVPADAFVAYGLALGPVVRYRHAWGPVHVEASLEWPFLIAPHVVWQGSSRTEPVYWQMLPVLGLGVGL
jgi:hypothetical protein